MGKSKIIAETAKAMAVRAAAQEARLALVAGPKRIDVTPERGRRNKFVSMGMARREVAVIDTLWNADKLTAAEYANLAHYRNQALQAEDDTAEEGTLAASRVMGGGGSAPGSRIPAKLLFTPAISETARIERELGALRDIAHAIAVENLSISQWCIHKHGGRERYDDRGRFVAMVPNREKENMGLALLDLKMAARRFSR